MKVVIIEDEKPAADKLRKALLNSEKEVEVLAQLGSVKESVQWFQNNALPDLVFLDIELSDGTSFQLLDQAAIDCPVIFTTAYDEYWQEAFEHNSIDYLLKPIKEDKLLAALNKYDKLKQYFSVNFNHLLTAQNNSEVRIYKKRFLVKRGVDYISIRTEDISYFYAAHKLVCLVQNNGQKFILDQSLADVEKQTDPDIFYRVNRKYLVNLSAIKRIKTLPKSKLLLEVAPPPSEEVIVSQESAATFKQWLEQ